MKSVDFINVNSDEYKKRFILHFTDLGMQESDAEYELSGLLECMDERETSNPEYDAEECLSYWGD